MTAERNYSFSPARFHADCTCHIRSPAMTHAKLPLALESKKKIPRLVCCTAVSPSTLHVDRTRQEQQPGRHERKVSPGFGEGERAPGEHRGRQQMDDHRRGEFFGSRDARCKLVQKFGSGQGRLQGTGKLASLHWPWEHGILETSGPSEDMADK